MISITSNNVIEIQEIDKKIEIAIDVCTDDLCLRKLEYLNNKLPLLMERNEVYKLNSKINLLVEALSKDSFYESRGIKTKEEEILRDLCSKFKLLILPMASEEKIANREEMRREIKFNYKEGLPNDLIDHSSSFELYEEDEEITKKLPKDLNFIR